MLLLQVLQKCLTEYSIHKKGHAGWIIDKESENQSSTAHRRWYFSYLCETTSRIVGANFSENCSIADGANTWIKLQLPEGSTIIQGKLNSHRNIALDVFSMSAYYLHLKYCRNAREKLGENFNLVPDFLIGNLDGPGVTSVAKSQQQEDVLDQTLLKTTKSDKF